MATSYYLDGKNTGLALTAPVTNNSTLLSKDSVNANGRISTTALTRKAWVEASGSSLKGRALKKAHNAYLREYADVASGEVAKALASGKLGIVGIGANKSGAGGTFKWVNRASIVDPVEVAKERANREKRDAVEASLKAAGVDADVIAKALAAFAK